VYSQVLETYIDGARVFDRADPAFANYAVGGFALPDAAIRPKPAPAL
jgi:hypothetical protein